MSETEFYELVIYAINILAIIYYGATSYIYRKHANTLENAVKDMMEVNKSTIEEYRVTQIYCLGDIMKKAISEENYELAETCKNLIIKLQTKQQS